MFIVCSDDFPILGMKAKLEDIGYRGFICFFFTKNKTKCPVTHTLCVVEFRFFCIYWSSIQMQYQKLGEVGGH